MVGPGGERIVGAPVDPADGGREEGAGGGGDLVVQEGGDLGEGCHLGVVEGVDAPVDVVAGPVTHEPAADGVLDPGLPGEVGSQALAQQVGGNPEAEVVAAEPLGARRLFEGQVVGDPATPGWPA